MTTPIIQALSSNIIHIRSKETNYNNLNSDFNITLKNAIEIPENNEAHIIFPVIYKIIYYIMIIRIY